MKKKDRYNDFISLYDIQKRKIDFMNFLNSSGKYIYCYSWSSNNEDSVIYASLQEGSLFFEVIESDNDYYIVDNIYITNSNSSYYNIQDFGINEIVYEEDYGSKDEYYKKLSEVRKHDINVFIDAVNYRIADYFAKKGYSHKAVMWALYNCQDQNWTLKKELKNNKEEKRIEESDFVYKLEQLKLKKEIEIFLSHNSEIPTIITEETFRNWSGLHGYKEYDLINMKVTGYKVLCWSSYQFGGNCNCVNHEPGEYIERDLDKYDLEYINFK